MRYRVFLSVRYAVAEEFVRDYAENLSSGGMFISGAGSLTPDSEVLVEIDLPGYGTYKVSASVTHVMNHVDANSHDRTQGAGLVINEAPRGFDEALSGYLIRLSRRSESLVLVNDSECGRLLGAAGYQIETFDVAEDINQATERTDITLVGVVAPKLELSQLRRTIRETAVNLLVEMNDEEALNEVLVELDRRLS